VIAAELAHWRRYFSGPVWERAFTHILVLGPDAEEGYTDLMGKDLFARVMSYETVEPAGSKLEAHRKYVDIQCPLAGGERIEWFPIKDLSALGDYNPDKDVIHFRRPDRAPLSVSLEPGLFAVFFPEDGHMPKLIVAEPRRMKKVVVKVSLDLLE
jgi:YhcH/YjgK/YiaL family protein